MYERYNEEYNLIRITGILQNLNNNYTISIIIAYENNVIILTITDNLVSST